MKSSFILKTIRPYLLALLGVIIFSATLPATKIAIQEVSPLFVFAARTIIASILAAFWLAKNKNSLANSHRLRKDIFISMFGTVFGFPLLTSYALTLTAASHGALVIALVPIFTAILSSLFFRTSRGVLFWAGASIGTLIVFSTIFMQNKILWSVADILLLFSAILVACGYVFGTRVAKQIGGSATISLSLLFSLPLIIPIFLFSFPDFFPSFKTLLALLYLGIFSMFLGFIFWYKGLSEGEADKISLVQMLQLFITYLISTFLLGEIISPLMLGSALIVVLCLRITKLAK